LAELPVWTKADLRELWEQAHDAPPSGGIQHSTGGSTGSPSKFYITRESYEWRTAVSDRGYGWAGAEEGQRSYYVWGVSITPPTPAHKVKADLQHWLQHRKYFNSFDFSESRKAQCCREIDAFRPKAIVGYAGNLVDLALFVRQNQDALTWRSGSAVTAADGLRPGQRELIKEALSKEVFLTYGSREFMLIGAECPEHRGYHLSIDNLWVEVVDDNGKPVPPGESGRILVTDLHNTATPFIRYEIGDVGVMATEPCPCGLPFPMLERVEGRIQERIQLPGGESLTALFIPHLMKEFEWVRAYQVRQLSDSEISMELITDEPLQADKTGEIARYLQPRVGDTMTITCRRVDALQKSASGKTPIVVKGERGTADEPQR
jgi:phenylacetate-CoA ligase